MASKAKTAQKEKEKEETPEKEASESESGELVEVQQKVPAKSEAKEPTERTDDPVRMYLREMGSVELLSREGEIAIAKRIEAGREQMIGGICESPLTIKALVDWHSKIERGEILLREIIDLDATYGGGPDGAAAEDGVEAGMEAEAEIEAEEPEEEPALPPQLDDDEGDDAAISLSAMELA